MCWNKNETLKYETFGLIRNINTTESRVRGKKLTLLHITGEPKSKQNKKNSPHVSGSVPLSNLKTIEIDSVAADERLTFPKLNLSLRAVSYSIFSHYFPLSDDAGISTWPLYWTGSIFFYIFFRWLYIKMFRINESILLFLANIFPRCRGITIEALKFHRNTLIPATSLAQKEIAIHPH